MFSVEGRPPWATRPGMTRLKSSHPLQPPRAGVVGVRTSLNSLVAVRTACTTEIRQCLLCGRRHRMDPNRLSAVPRAVKRTRFASRPALRRTRSAMESDFDRCDFVAHGGHARQVRPVFLGFPQRPSRSSHSDYCGVGPPPQKSMKLTCNEDTRSEWIQNRTNQCGSTH